MNQKEFEQYIFDNIPVTKAFGIHVTSFSNEKVGVQAAFIKNTNHQSSVFGGSISNLLILAAWGRMVREISKIDPQPNVVIQSSEVEFFKPIYEDFESVCGAIPVEEMKRFIASLQSKGKARIQIKSTIEVNGNVMAAFTGNFVGLANQ